MAFAEFIDAALPTLAVINIAGAMIVGELSRTDRIIRFALLFSGGFALFMWLLP